MLYRFIRWILFLIPPENAHHLSLKATTFLSHFPGFKFLMRMLWSDHKPDMAVELWGKKFSNPIGLAAGFDKNGAYLETLSLFGFGFLELGTVTPKPQSGSPKPRLFRLPRDRALINRMGFNNEGAIAVKQHLCAQSVDCVVGVNVGKNKTTPSDHAVADFCIAARKLVKHADYIVINVSSPNTPGLRDLQAVNTLKTLVREVRAVIDAHQEPTVYRPLMIKIAPDLSDEDIDAIADMALNERVDAIIATNTTVDWSGLKTSPAVLDEIASGVQGVDGASKGGLSGAPLRERSLAVLKRLHEKVDSHVVLIASGGIENGADAWARIEAGASLLQIYTAFVYKGPSAVKKILRGVRKRMKASGVQSLQAVVGRPTRGPQGTGSIWPALVLSVWSSAQMVMAQSTSAPANSVRAVSQQPQAVLASGEGFRIAAGDLVTSINTRLPVVRASYLEPGRLDGVLLMMVKEKLLALEAKDRKLLERADVREEIDRLLTRVLLEDEFARIDKQPVREVDIQSYYQRHIADSFTRPERIRISVLRVNTDAESRRAMQKAKKWNTSRFHAWIKSQQKAVDDKAEMSVYLPASDAGWIFREAAQIDENIAKVAWEMKSFGELRAVDTTDGAKYVIRLDDREAAEVYPLEKVRYAIASRVRFERREAAQEALIRRLSQQRRVQVNAVGNAVLLVP